MKAFTAFLKTVCPMTGGRQQTISVVSSRPFTGGVRPETIVEDRKGANLAKVTSTRDRCILQIVQVE